MCVVTKVAKVRKKKIVKEKSRCINSQATVLSQRRGEGGNKVVRASRPENTLKLPIGQGEKGSPH